MNKLKKFFKTKNMLFASLLLLLCCLAGIGLMEPSLVQKPEKFTAEENMGTVSYYPGTRDTAILLLAPQEGNFSYKPLLRELLHNGYPVLLTHHDADSPLDSSQRSSLVEQESNLLEMQSGISAENQIWISTQDGADDLMDQVILGNLSAKGAAVISPSFEPGLIDYAIIQDGNYQNKSDWINTLSPDMIRQPLLLLTSNRDDIATPYQMTLLYNKFSTDEIIHVGGVYQAKKNNVSLSIIDGSVHPAMPSHKETLYKIESFLKDLGESVSFSFVPSLRPVLITLSLLLLSVFLVCVVLVSPSYAPEVSYGPVSSLKLAHKGKLFAVLGLSWLTALIGAVAAWFLTQGLSCPLMLTFFAFLLVFFLASLGFFKLFSLTLPQSFQTVSLSGKSLLSSIGLLAVLTLSFVVLHLSGNLSAGQISPVMIPVGILMTLPVFHRLLTIEDQLRQYDSPAPALAGFYSAAVVSMALFFLFIRIFVGATAGYGSLILLGLFILHYLAAEAIFTMCGHLILSTALSALSLSCFSLLFYVL